MGLLETIFGGSETTTDIIDNVISTEQGEDIINQLLGGITGTAGTTLDSILPELTSLLTGGVTSVNLDLLTSAITDPSVLLTEDVLSSIVDPILSTTQERANTLGISDSPLTSTISSAISPALTDYYTNQLSTLASAASLDLSAAGLESSNALNLLSTLSGIEATEFEALLGAAGFATPIVTSESSSTAGILPGVSDLIGAVSGAAETGIIPGLG